MNHVLTVLLKTIIIPFYRSHAGLLFFVFYIMFGMVEPAKLISYHQTLIEGMFASTAFMLCIYLGLDIIQLKNSAVYSFPSPSVRLSIFKQPDAGFTAQSLWVWLLVITVITFEPVLIYTIFIYLIGISQHHYAGCLGIVLFQAILCCTNAWIILTFLRTQHIFSLSFASLRIPNIGGRIGFYISYFLSEEKIAILISKTFSLVLLYIVRAAIEPGNDFRILGLTWVFVLLAHTFLIPKVRMFEDRYLVWIKSLPISTVRTCLLYFVFYTGLMLPELIFSVSMLESVFEFLCLLLLSGVLLMFIHAYLLKPNRNPEKFSNYLFWLFILSFLAILSKLIAVLILMLGAMACIRIIKRYYINEPAID